MTDRHLATALLIGVIALGVVLASRTETPLPPRGQDVRLDDPSGDGFIEVRFRLPRSTPARPAERGHVPQGSLVNTGNPLDVAIEGAGFFQLSAPDGTTRYTRRGQFVLNKHSTLVTPDGHLLQPQITLPADASSLSLGADGTVSVITADGPGLSTMIGQITILRFINPPGLRRVGAHLYEETEESGIPSQGTPGQEGLGLLRQGFLEQNRNEMVTQVIELLHRMMDEEGSPRITAVRGR